MIDFYKRAVKKIDKLDKEQIKELLIASVEEIILLENVINSINVGIIVCDVENNLVMVNKCAKRMLPLNFIEGIPIWSAVNDDKIVDFFKNNLMNGERVVDSEIDVTYHGRNKLLSINILPLVNDKCITGTLIYIDDITDKRRAIARLRRAENLASLTTLAAGVAHEIKNPLGAISIHMQLLQKMLSKNKDIEKSTERYFDVVKEEIDRLNRIVVDFLFAVRPMTLELRETDINKLLFQLVELESVTMEKAGIECNLELADNIPKILIDERYMKQAILNLITNAKTAMPNGGTLSINSNYSDNEIKIIVKDTGTGIKQDNLAKIFEPYFTTTQTGTGLGLTHVYKIIKEHHGEISVHSEEDKGALFEIILHVPQKDTKLITYESKDGNL